MAEILKNEIKIPVWMFSILLTIMLGLLGFTAANATNRQQILQNGIEITNIKNNEIKTLQADKADKAEVVQMQSSLVRIENKLDQWILINRK
jgi:hypothetical protein